MRRFWKGYTLGLLCLGTGITTIAFAATLEYTTYYPTPPVVITNFRGFNLAVGDSTFQSNVDSPTPLPIGYGVFQTRVGINTVIPEQMLDIYSQAAATLRLWGAASGVASNFSALELRSDEGRLRSTSGDRAWQLAHEKTTNKLQISHQPLGSSFSPRVTLTPAGNVGIGTTIPGQRLEVSGLTVVDALYLTPRPAPPDGATHGMIYYDGDRHKLRVFAGQPLPAGWKDVDTQGAGELPANTLPRPAWDSGWVAILPGESVLLDNNPLTPPLGIPLHGDLENPLNQFVYMEFRGSPSWGINQRGYGDRIEIATDRGISWRNKTATSITVSSSPNTDPSIANEVRIQIWKIE